MTTKQHPNEIQIQDKNLKELADYALSISMAHYEALVEQYARQSFELSWDAPFAPNTYNGSRKTVIIMEEKDAAST